MSLTKKDLQDIGQIVDEKINTAIDTKVPVMIAREIGSLRLEMNQRFDKTDQKIDDVETRLTEKIEQVKQMETEDIQVIYKDVALLKKKMAV